MSTSDTKAISELNELIEFCKDGQNGFATAAEGVKADALKSELKQYSEQRAQFAEDLRRQVQALGGKPEAHGSTVGAMHRGWIDLKTALTQDDDHAVLAECERGEDAAKEAYEKAVNGTDIPGTILPIIQKQYEQVKETHDRIRELRDGVPISSRP
jgi:uncharacterized protein (TIGR02284 family)